MILKTQDEVGRWILIRIERIFTGSHPHNKLKNAWRLCFRRRVAHELTSDVFVISSHFLGRCSIICFEKIQSTFPLIMYEMPAMGIFIRESEHCGFRKETRNTFLYSCGRGWQASSILFPLIFKLDNCKIGRVFCWRDVCVVSENYKNLKVYSRLHVRILQATIFDIDVKL